MEKEHTEVREEGLQRRKRERRRKRSEMEESSKEKRIARKNKALSKQGKKN
jgi:hypothetical protein